MNYRLLEDAYFGTGGFASGSYLTKHKRESDEDYDFRRRNAYYLNYFAPIVNAVVDPIFKRPPLRDYEGGIADIVADFLSDVDGAGMTMDTFMKRAAITAKVYGVAFIVVDMEQEVYARNMAELRSTRQYPYIRIVRPADIYRYGIDKSGNILFIEFKEVSKIVDGMVVYRYCYYDRDGWRISDEGRVTASEGGYRMERVPVIPLFSWYLEEKTLRPTPDMMAIAKTAMAVYNHCSWLGEILRNQTFPLLTVPMLDAAELTIGTNNALGYSPDSLHAPAFIAPSSDPASILQAQIAGLIREMYRMASLSFMQDTADQMSGVARQWEFERTNQQLANFADNCGRAEEQVMQVFARYLNADLDYSVSYPDDFGIVDIGSELDQAQKVLDLGLTDGLKEEVLKKVLSAYCPNLSDEHFDELMDEMEADERDKENAEAVPTVPIGAIGAQNQPPRPADEG